MVQGHTIWGHVSGRNKIEWNCHHTVSRRVPRPFPSDAAMSVRQNENENALRLQFGLHWQKVISLGTESRLIHKIRIDSGPNFLLHQSNDLLYVHAERISQKSRTIFDNHFMIVSREGCTKKPTQWQKSLCILFYFISLLLKLMFIQRRPRLLHRFTWYIHFP